MLNQTRTRPGAPAGDGDVSAGGPPLKLYASVRIELDAARGNLVPFRILKNKAGQAFQDGILRWENGWKFAESP